MNNAYLIANRRYVPKKLRQVFTALIVTHDIRDWREVSLDLVAAVCSIKKDRVRECLIDLDDAKVIRYSRGKGKVSKVIIKNQEFLDALNQDPLPYDKDFSYSKVIAEEGVKLSPPPIEGFQLSSTPISKWNTRVDMAEEFLHLQSTTNPDLPLKSALQKSGVTGLLYYLALIRRKKLKSNHRRIKELEETVALTLGLDSRNRKPTEIEKFLTLCYLSRKLFSSSLNLMPCVKNYSWLINQQDTTFEEVALCLWKMHRNKFWSNRLERKIANDKQFHLMNVLKQCDDPRERIEQLLGGEYELDPTSEAESLFTRLIKPLVNNFEEYEIVY